MQGSAKQACRNIAPHVLRHCACRFMPTALHCNAMFNPSQRAITWQALYLCCKIITKGHHKRANLSYFSFDLRAQELEDRLEDQCYFEEFHNALHIIKGPTSVYRGLGFGGHPSMTGPNGTPLPWNSRFPAAMSVVYHSDEWSIYRIKPLRRMPSQTTPPGIGACGLEEEPASLGDAADGSGEALARLFERPEGQERPLPPPALPAPAEIIGEPPLPIIGHSRTEHFNKLVIKYLTQAQGLMWKRMGSHAHANRFTHCRATAPAALHTPSTIAPTALHRIEEKGAEEPVSCFLSINIPLGSLQVLQGMGSARGLGALGSQTVAEYQASSTLLPEKARGWMFLQRSHASPSRIKRPRSNTSVELRNAHTLVTLHRPTHFGERVALRELCVEAAPMNTVGAQGDPQPILLDVAALGPEAIQSLVTWRKVDKMRYTWKGESPGVHFETLLRSLCDTGTCRIHDMPGSREELTEAAHMMEAEGHIEHCPGDEESWRLTAEGGGHVQASYALERPRSTAASLAQQSSPIAALHACRV